MNDSRPSNPRSSRDLGACSGRSGFGLAEVAVVLAILVVAASLFSRMLVATTGVREVNRENGLAAEAARVALERMRNVPFEEVFARYNPDPDDDPEGPGTAPGNRFAVPDLEALPTAPDGLQGEIVLPTYPPGTPPQIPQEPGGLFDLLEGFLGGGEAGGEESGAGAAGWELREDYQDEALGMPRDLSGDNLVDAVDHGSDYLLLPVLVRIEWQARHGPSSHEVYTILTDFRREP